MLRGAVDCNTVNYPLDHSMIYRKQESYHLDKVRYENDHTPSKSLILLLPAETIVNLLNKKGNMEVVK